MELRHLRAFIAAARLEHFSKAAETLEIAQPALSQLMKTLEAELGVALFRRKNRGVQLTPAGEAFLPHAEDAVRASGLAADAARRARRGEVGAINIGYHSALFEHHLPQLIRHYFTTWPDVSVSLMDVRIQAQFAWLLEGKIDIGFARVSNHHLPEGLRTRCFSLSRLVLLMPDNHPLAAEFSGDLSALRQETFIFLEDPLGVGLTSHTLQLCRRYHLHPTTIMPVPSLMSIPGLIAAGIGISILPEALVQLSMPGLKTHALSQPDMVSELSLITRENERSRAVMHFVDEAVKWSQ
ncbi:LysR family transcriptional regulator [Pluralibacter gergoviae]|uniref:LysR family transcriptional regulator n=1 Tax=Pluralibacter gergoviae TaxID=61647 RepID=UPI000BFB4820|nr:LysR family transcriptional regulator [Pluralibacter gergoviae]ELO7478328.1 LysR family transcriptional regulator [Pluralibacter gergoviae]ELW9442789.1 LysR family transcriptional regulator [Pluralibacter gergoviae]MCK1064663.1 LysR family transcriptional regulator [Pluralibacter gergoviae]MCV7759829.1 LysR family transcriptional regulator [Pluralibacter gergoviae]PHH48032.1 LysR family transcriptional regulator [Pluralibacter gergoviae]